MSIELAPHQQRVITEFHQLHDRISALSIFFSTDLYKTGVPADEQDRLKRQWDHMVGYLRVLEERIAAFGGDRGKVRVITPDDAPGIFEGAGLA